MYFLKHLLQRHFKSCLPVKKKSMALIFQHATATVDGFKCYILSYYFDYLIKCISIVFYLMFKNTGIVRVEKSHLGASSTDNLPKEPCIKCFPKTLPAKSKVKVTASW